MNAEMRYALMKDGEIQTEWNELDGTIFACVFKTYAEAEEAAHRLCDDDCFMDEVDIVRLTIEHVETVTV